MAARTARVYLQYPLTGTALAIHVLGHECVRPGGGWLELAAGDAGAIFAVDDVVDGRVEEE